MKLSLITVCYNVEKTVENTILSVLAQDYPDIEYIVIDGASRDGTLAILERYRDRFSHFVSEPDKGIYDAMNKGLALATGDIIGLINADDILAHDKVISTVVSLMQNESLDAVYGDVEYFDDAQPQKVVRRYSSSHFRPSRIAWGWIPAHPTLYLRREIYDTYGHFRTDYRIAGDYEFIARAFYKNNLRYRYIPKPLVRMRIGGVSTKNLATLWLLNREVMRACRANNVRTNWVMILSKYPLKIWGLLFK